VDLSDALYILQYLNGIRPACDLALNTDSCVNAVNAASVKHDAGGADMVTPEDARYIADYVMGTRDAFFNLISNP